MKPPARKRVKKSRELRPVPELTGRSACKWPPQEQRRLLTALTRLCPRGEGAQLDPERVQEYLPSRTPAEINSVLDTLKEKVVLFAKTKQRAERREARRHRKPLELWIQEASAVSGGAVEESLSSAFFQLLTVASTEPCAPSPPVHLSSSTPLSKGQSGAQSASPQLSRSPSQSQSSAAHTVTEHGRKTASHQPHTTAQSSMGISIPSSMCQVSFEKIYHYLSVLHQPGQQCMLSPLESAVVLDLLMSLPEQLLVLDCDPLMEHLTQKYQHFSSGTDPRSTRDKTVKRQPPTAPPNLQQPPTAPPNQQQPPTAPPNQQQPPAAPPNQQHPPAAPPNLQQPPTAPLKPLNQQQPPTAPPEHPQPPQGESSTKVQPNSALNPFLIPVSLLICKAQADQTLYN